MTDPSPIGDNNKEHHKAGFIHVYNVTNDSQGRIIDADKGYFIGIDPYTASLVKDFIDNIPVKQITTGNIFDFLNNIKELCEVVIESEND